MSKKSKIILACTVALLLVVTAFFSLLPQIVRWSIPRVIKAKTGYQAVIESIDVSIIKPSITVTGISLQAKADGEVMGKVERVSFIGVWGNPFRRQLISPVLLIIHGVDAHLELVENRDGGSPISIFCLIYWFSCKWLLSKLNGW